MQAIGMKHYTKPNPKSFEPMDYYLESVATLMIDIL